MHRWEGACRPSNDESLDGSMPVSFSFSLSLSLSPSRSSLKGSRTCSHGPRTCSHLFLFYISVSYFLISYFPTCSRTCLFYILYFWKYVYSSTSVYVYFQDTECRSFERCLILHELEFWTYQENVFSILKRAIAHDNPCIAQPMRWRSTLIECLILHVSCRKFIRLIHKIRHQTHT